jgi:hypothetical protein
MLVSLHVIVETLFRYSKAGFIAVISKNSLLLQQCWFHCTFFFKPTVAAAMLVSLHVIVETLCRYSKAGFIAVISKNTVVTAMLVSLHLFFWSALLLQQCWCHRTSF